jgi:hypothetical protein
MMSRHASPATDGRSPTVAEPHHDARHSRLARQAVQLPGFEDTLQRVRVEHGRKRDLMKLIDQKGW